LLTADSSHSSLPLHDYLPTCLLRVALCHVCRGARPRSWCWLGRDDHPSTRRTTKELALSRAGSAPRHSARIDTSSEPGRDTYKRSEEHTAELQSLGQFV